MPTTAERARIIAVLGPTNTGKTHLAIERMLGYQTGMIGFPLRLLARENYDRIVRLKGTGAVALLTGEERIMPPRPRWFVCTVESMPAALRVDFLAVDEIQLCADPDRGHIFTDRLLHARGAAETMFLGADTIRPLIRRLVPGVEFVARPRFSKLTYTGTRKIHRLPPRSAIVSFSAAEVYGIAEQVRRQTGGAAVVLGALSPRARNAQVGLYQAGEVDYLVATDAIGMGLNMDIDHVAFAALRKFDGRAPRHLEASELAQIAGRAGRHMNDGTFGTTEDVGGLSAETVDALESHNFPTLRRIFWRNSDLPFTSAAALQSALARPPSLPGLVRARDADDERALRTLAADPEVLRRAGTRDRVRLLWEVCQIPDFRKSLAEQHTRLLGAIFRHLTGPDERLPDAWLDLQLRRIDRTDGDIDTLINRIANVRTWTFVSHRADWVTDAAHWQERSRAIEDRLSDALHERLTQRFVDRRTAVLLRRIKDGGEMEPAVGESGAVLVDGHPVGRLDGFRFHAEWTGEGAAARAASAIERSLAEEVGRRAARLIADGDDAFLLDDEGGICWNGAVVAHLARGPHILRPTVEVLPAELLEPAARELIRERLARWLADHVGKGLAGLVALLDADVSGAPRGLAFQLGEALGSLPRSTAQTQLAALSDRDRKTLARLGVRLGVESVYMPDLLKPGRQRLRAILWANHHAMPVFPLPPPGRVLVARDPAIPLAFFEAIGFRPLGDLLVRLDMLERFAAPVRKLGRAGPFAIPPELAGMVGATMAEAEGLLHALGYRATSGEPGALYAPARRPKPRAAKPRPDRHRDADSPFAPLRRLATA